MAFKWQDLVFSGLQMSICSTLLFVACSPKSSSKSSNTSVQISRLSEVAATCEQKIRNQMIQKNIQFKSSSGFDKIINRANQDLAKITDKDFVVNQLRGENVSTEMVYSNAATEAGESYTFDLSLSDKTSDVPMNLNISYASVNPGHYESLNQYFKVSESCELTLTETDFEQITKNEDHTYSYKKNSNYMDGHQEDLADNFSAPNNEQISNFMPSTLNNLSKIPNDAYVYMPGMGLSLLKIQKAFDKKIKSFNLEFNFSESKIIFEAKGNSLKIDLGNDQALGAQLMEISSQRRWIVSKAIWDLQLLGTSRDLDSQMSDQLPSDYMSTHDSMKVLTQSKLSYDHLSAYWNVHDNGADIKTGMLSLTLSQNKAVTIKDKSSAIDLKSNDTIQTNLPEIQKIADGIRAQSKNRRVQISLILQYLYQNYSYDYDMVKNNIVRSLTTEEALSRKKGVCQHYAVIFTTIARALKIPTRIVVGYLIEKEGTGSHAWVETSPEEGVWQVVEPQSPYGLTDTDTKEYFPVGRATFLEDRKASMMDYMADSFESSYVLLPN